MGSGVVGGLVFGRKEWVRWERSAFSTEGAFPRIFGFSI